MLQQAFAGQKLQITLETEPEDLMAGLPDPPNTVRDQAHLERLLLEALDSSSH